MDITWTSPTLQLQTLYERCTRESHVTEHDIEMLEEAFRSKYKRVWETAVSIIMCLSHHAPRLCDLIMRLSEDSQFHIRWRILVGFKMVEPPLSVMQSVLHRAFTDRSKKVREHAIDVCGTHKISAMLPELKILAQDPTYQHLGIPLIIKNIKLYEQGMIAKHEFLLCHEKLRLV